jgi:predicted anti-sigma-YlaC factor YlaD
MKCMNQITMQAYSDSEVSKTQAKKIEAHLSECLSCQKRLKRIATDKELLRNALNRLNPIGEPPRKIIFPEKPIIPNGRTSRIKEFFASSIRIPVPVGLVLLLLFLGLASYAVISQIGKTPSQFRSSNLGRRATLYIFNDNSVQAFDLKSDLSGYKPIEKSNTFILKEGTQ